MPPVPVRCFWQNTWAGRLAQAINLLRGGSAAASRRERAQLAVGAASHGPERGHRAGPARRAAAPLTTHCPAATPVLPAAPVEPAPAAPVLPAASAEPDPAAPVLPSAEAPALPTLEALAPMETPAACVAATEGAPAGPATAVADSAPAVPAANALEATNASAAAAADQLPHEGAPAAANAVPAAAPEAAAAPAP